MSPSARVESPHGYANNMRNDQHLFGEPRTSFKYHQFRGRLGMGDLHPGGAPATQRILRWLTEQNVRRVLEVGAGIGNTILSLTIVFIAPIARVAEAVTTQIRNLDYVEAARASCWDWAWPQASRPLPPRS